MFGVSRKSYYEWVGKAEQYGLSALLPKQRRRPHQPNVMSSEEVSVILAESVSRPTLGPKSLLRHPMCISRAEDFTDGSTFHRILWDDAQKGNSTARLKPDDKIKRVVLSSGKVYYDLLAERDAQGLDDTYLLLVE